MQREFGPFLTVDVRRFVDRRYDVERTHPQVADDLGIGRSTLGKWLAKHREADLLSGPHEDTAKELARLRKENEILRAERDLLKKAAAFFAKETSR